MRKPDLALLACLSLVLGGISTSAQAAQVSAQEPPPGYDAALAKRTGADDHGMRSYVLVILRTGPTRVNDPEQRKAMFAGHMANIRRLSDAGQMVLAGPFGDASGDWRGLFVFAVDSVEEAKTLVATDPVIVQGEMVADYHPWYGSAATMLVNELHAKLAKQSF